jgi:hypothetical protein
MAADDVFDRAMHLARQRAQMLAYANDPDTPTHRADEQLGPTTRRQMLARARKVERIIVGLADWAIRDARLKAVYGREQ